MFTTERGRRRRRRRRIGNLLSSPARQVWERTRDTLCSIIVHHQQWATTSIRTFTWVCVCVLWRHVRAAVRDIYIYTYNNFEISPRVIIIIITRSAERIRRYTTEWGRSDRWYYTGRDCQLIIRYTYTPMYYETPSHVRQTIRYFPSFEIGIWLVVIYLPR